MEIFSISGLMYRLLKPLRFSISGSWIKTGLLCIAFFMKMSVSAQVPKVTTAGLANHYLISRGEVILRFAKPVGISLDEFTAFLSIDNFKNDTLTVYTNETGFQQFIKLNIPFDVLVPPSLQTGILTSRRKAEPDWHNRYPSYAEYVSLMEAFASDYPHLCQLRQFGTSINDRKLLALKISDNPVTRETEPVVLYSSTMHGDETLGYMLMLRLIEFLLVNYDTDPNVKHLVDQVEIWINPLANPDGSYFLSDTSVAGATRFNANKADLNRNFPDPAKGDHPDLNNWQKETLAMMDFMKSLPIVLAANFHGGSEVVNYPWDAFYRLHPDDEWYSQISRAYADTVHIYGPTGYMTALNNGITKGYQWYPVYGGRQDYVNYFLHGREVTVELSYNKTPPENSLNDYWNYNKQSLLQYIGQVLTGVTGIVTDSVTGQPLDARISIENHDIDNSFVTTESTNGTFYRLTGKGNYVFLVSSTGYSVKRLPVSVSAGELTQLDIKLAPVTVPGLYPNPFSDLVAVYITGSGDDLILEFTDLSGRKVKRITQAVVVPGRQEIQITGLASGIYIVNLFYGNQTIKQLMVRKGF